MKGLFARLLLIAISLVSIYFSAYYITIALVYFYAGTITLGLIYSIASLFLCLVCVMILIIVIRGHL